ncbi:hypothetical protein HPB47_007274 [Ixodes persulcatus]|uniref:Uncharacterized protein n=1 Tax=Ixodes persulcatus TaxID=34615 RepID=A0AC60P8V4_IXOPE|nr:hypothetical protein HPB47_007274 [Ixodes persulcatus]
MGLRGLVRTTLDHVSRSDRGTLRSIFCTLCPGCRHYPEAPDPYHLNRRYHNQAPTTPTRAMHCFEAASVEKSRMYEVALRSYGLEDPTGFERSEGLRVKWLPWLLSFMTNEVPCRIDDDNATALLRGARQAISGGKYPRKKNREKFGDRNCIARMSSRTKHVRCVHIINGEEVRIPRGEPELLPAAVPALLPNAPIYLSKKASQPRPPRK